MTINNTEMDKYEAIKAMEAGKKVRHRFFDSHEWITIRNGDVLSEDGYLCSGFLFWGDRTHKDWETGWQIVNEIEETEKRTAEEMYLYCVEQMQPDGTNCSLDDEKTIYKAMHEFAAHELTDYKARLKNAIAGRNDYFILLDIIDTA